MDSEEHQSISLRGKGRTDNGSLYCCVYDRRIFIWVHPDRIYCCCLLYTSDLKEKKVLYKNQFEQKRILELMDFLKQFDVMQSYSMNGQSYAARKDMENVDYYQLDSNTKAIIHNSRKLINDLEDFLKEHDKTETVEKITLLFRTKEERAKVWNCLLYTSYINVKISPEKIILK